MDHSRKNHSLLSTVRTTTIVKVYVFLTCSITNLCNLTLDAGPCAAYVTRYGFNPQTKRCESFTYGGCEGNMNNFETEEECMARCGLPIADICTTRCGPNAYCRDSVCICNGGYTGDPYTGCQRLSGRLPCYILRTNAFAHRAK
ncbi:unnamed protein product [Schistocephalus solidus]|uniref:BPTI/Kunitz inhibitor domain-containing protein n=1 Tax=Schistocephalus solidus TaxID=70667 RepID=A0A183T1W8_SCHSO|nr:unnamed protein product [Schistocephalus solidus]